VSGSEFELAAAGDRDVMVISTTDPQLQTERFVPKNPGLEAEKKKHRKKEKKRKKKAGASLRDGEIASSDLPSSFASIPSTLHPLFS